MSADPLLSRLDGVRRTGQGRWLARCPAHEDRTASLSIRELDDGRVLVHDFAGCDVEHVLAATGLGFDALFPTGPLGEFKSPRRLAFPAIDVLQAIAFEARVVGLVAYDIGAGKTITEADRERVKLAAERIIAAAEECIHA